MTQLLARDQNSQWTGMDKQATSEGQARTEWAAGQGEDTLFPSKTKRPFVI